MFCFKYFPKTKFPTKSSSSSQHSHTPVPQFISFVPLQLILARTISTSNSSLGSWLTWESLATCDVDSCDTTPGDQNVSRDENNKQVLHLQPISIINCIIVSFSTNCLPRWYHVNIFK